MAKAPAVGGLRTSYTDAIIPGFELRVFPDGRRVFAFRYENVAGRSIRMSIGRYGAGGGNGRTTLAAAREVAAQYRVKVRSGADPQSEQRAEVLRRQTATIRTVDELIDSYLAAARTRVRASTWALNHNRLTRHVRPGLGALPIEDVRRQDVRHVLLKIGARHPTTARGVAVLIGSVFRHARIDLEMSVANPAEGLPSLFPKRTRDRVLSDAELRAIWRATSFSGDVKAPLTQATALCIQLAGLTLQRSLEVVGAHDREIDLGQKIWTVPAARSKNKREHLVPLSVAAVRIITMARQVRGPRTGPGPLFPARDNADEPMDRHSITRAMARLCASLGISDAGMHDLRRTGATNLTSERIAVPRFHVSAVLGHISETGGITAVYDRNNYIVQKRQALDAWANLLEAIAFK